MVKPISFEEINVAKKATIPDAIIVAANELLISNWDGKAARFTKNALISAYIKLIPDDDRSPSAIESELYKKHWLDIEELFSDVGWNVIFNSPDRDESFEDCYTFKKKYDK
jgi:ribosomal protein L14